MLGDIDAIAAQLRKLQDAYVLTLWCPLHEAGGGWSGAARSGRSPS